MYKGVAEGTPFKRRPIMNKHTSLLTPYSKVLLEKQTSSQLVKKFPAFYGTRMLITAVQVPGTCPYPEPVQSSPRRQSYFLKIHLNIVLSSTPMSPKSSLSSGFPHQNPLRTSLLSHTCYMPHQLVLLLE